MNAGNDDVASALLDALAMYLGGAQMHELGRESSLAALGIDSLRIAAVLAHVEYMIDFRFSPEQLVWCYEVNTVDELVAAIERARSGEQ